MSEFIEPADAVERDGEVISGADYNSIEQNLPEYDDVSERAVRAAGDLIDSPDAPEVSVVEVSEAERRYDEAADKVERRMDQGLDGKAAWHEADPTGKIRGDYEEEERVKQAALNHEKVEEIKQATHDAKVAAIEQILDPEKRKHAMNELLAHERATEEKKHRW